MRSDENLRQLARLAKSGDLGAAVKLRLELTRRGLMPTYDELAEALTKEADSLTSTTLAFGCRACPVPLKRLGFKRVKTIFPGDTIKFLRTKAKYWTKEVDRHTEILKTLNGIRQAFLDDPDMTTAELAERLIEAENEFQVYFSHLPEYRKEEEREVREKPEEFLESTIGYWKEKVRDDSLELAAIHRSINRIAESRRSIQFERETDGRSLPRRVSREVHAIQVGDYDELNMEVLDLIDEWESRRFGLPLDPPPKQAELGYGPKDKQTILNTRADAFGHSVEVKWLLRRGAESYVIRQDVTLILPDGEDGVYFLGPSRFFERRDVDWVTL